MNDSERPTPDPAVRAGVIVAGGPAFAAAVSLSFLYVAADAWPPLEPAAAIATEVNLSAAAAVAAYAGFGVPGTLAARVGRAVACAVAGSLVFVMTIVCLWPVVVG